MESFQTYQLGDGWNLEDLEDWNWIKLFCLASNPDLNSSKPDQSSTMNGS